MADIPVLQPHIDLAPPGEPQPKADATGAKLYADSLPSTVQIRNLRNDGLTALGSGFFVDSTHVVTDEHVVYPSRELFVVGPDGKYAKAEIEKLDDVDDLALLKLIDPVAGVKPVQIGKALDLGTGDPVYALSHPLGDRQTYLSPGSYTRPSNALETCRMSGSQLCGPDEITSGNRSDAAQFMVQPKELADMHVEHGSSGGPVFNAQEKLVGVVDLKLPDSDTPTWFTPSENVTSMIDSPSKFRFQYQWQQAGWVEKIKSDPEAGLVSAGIYSGLGYMGYQFLSKRPSFAVLPGVVGGMLLNNDFDKFRNSSDIRDQFVYGIDSAADALILGGSATMMFAPADKKGYGLGAIAVGSLTRAAVGLIPSHRNLVGVSRSDGSVGLPLQIS